MEFKTVLGRGNKMCKDVFMGQETETCEPYEFLHLEKQ